MNEEENRDGFDGDGGVVCEGGRYGNGRGVGRGSS